MYKNIFSQLFINKTKGENMKINIPGYIPPKNLGEGLNRVKTALGCGDLLKNANGFRLYKANNGGTVYMTIGEMHKTKGIVPESAEFNHKNYDTYAGTALRLRRSENCGKMGTKPNQIMQYIRARFVSDAVTDSTGTIKSKPIKAITDFVVINSPGGKPIVKYGCGKHCDKTNKIPGYVKEVKSEDIPKEYTGVVAPDGNVVYYLKDTVRNGKRAVDMRVFEQGLNVQIL